MAAVQGWLLLFSVSSRCGYDLRAATFWDEASILIILDRPYYNIVVLIAGCPFRFSMLAIKSVGPGPPKPTALIIHVHVPVV